MPHRRHAIYFGSTARDLLLALHISKAWRFPVSHNLFNVMNDLLRALHDVKWRSSVEERQPRQGFSIKASSRSYEEANAAATAAAQQMWRRRDLMGAIDLMATIDLMVRLTRWY